MAHKSVGVDAADVSVSVVVVRVGVESGVSSAIATPRPRLPG